MRETDREKERESERETERERERGVGMGGELTEKERPKGDK